MLASYFCEYGITRQIMTDCRNPPNSWYINTHTYMYIVYTLAYKKLILYVSMCILRVSNLRVYTDCMLYVGCACARDRRQHYIYVTRFACMYVPITYFNCQLFNVGECFHWYSTEKTNSYNLAL